MDQLYASGFNAWGQLSFEDTDSLSGDNVDDVHDFTCILQGYTITEVRAFLSHTTCTSGL